MKLYWNFLFFAYFVISFSTFSIHGTLFGSNRKPKNNKRIKKQKQNKHNRRFNSNTNEKKTHNKFKKYIASLLIEIKR